MSQRLRFAVGSCLSLLFVLLFAASASAGTPRETALYSFSYGADGSTPISNVIFDSTGNLYGTTSGGGSSTQCELGSGCGTIFMLAPPSGANKTWTETVLYSFQGQASNDGSAPETGLVFDKTGSLYGTTASGGTFNDGTVFKLTPPATQGGAWTETVLYSFQGGSDGIGPTSEVIFDVKGSLYGTTPYGGSSGYGTVFKLAPPVTGTAWTETILHTFGGQTVNDGSLPFGGLVIRDTVLYGTTAGGGLSTEGGSAGTVFKLTPPVKQGQPWTETILHSFIPGHGDGCATSPGLIFDKSGALYGTTQLCGSASLGTAFKLTPSTGGSWTESILFNFMGGAGGSYPSNPLIFDTKGNLYSTAAAGSATPGVVYELSPPAVSGGAWTETILWTFTGGNDGNSPQAGLAIRNGMFYGTTFSGGTNGDGTVFRVTN